MSVIYYHVYSLESKVCSVAPRLVPHWAPSSGEYTKVHLLTCCEIVSAEQHADSSETKMTLLRHTDSRVWESSPIRIFLQPWRLTFIFPANKRTNGAGRVEMIWPPSFSYLSRQLCQLEFKTPRPSGRCGSTQRGRNYLWELWPQKR